MTAWPEPQPISTAPRDGTPILAWAISEQAMEEDNFEPEYSWMVVCHSPIQPGSWWLSETLERVYRPKFWLPTPPAQTGEGE